MVAARNRGQTEKIRQKHMKNKTCCSICFGIGVTAIDHNEQSHRDAAVDYAAGREHARDDDLADQK